MNGKWLAAENRVRIACRYLVLHSCFYVWWGDLIFWDGTVGEAGVWEYEQQDVGRGFLSGGMMDGKEVWNSWILIL